jgi:hypothetical protein
MPSTTEQILHPDKWRAHEAGIVIPVPTASALGSGFAKAGDDVDGELGMVLTYGEWMDPQAAKIAAAGWGGDRSAMFVNGNVSAAIVHLRYDAGPKDDDFAARAWKLLSPALEAKVGSGKASSKGANEICFERADMGPLYVSRKGKDIVIALGPATRGSPSTAWKSAGNCGKSRAWANEVLR